MSGAPLVDRLLSTAEVCGVLGMGESSFYEWIKTNNGGIEMLDSQEPRVVFTPPPDEVDFTAFGATVLELAGELDAAEAKVRDALLAALDRCDVAGARQIVERWTKEPIEDLAARIQDTERLR